MTKRTKRVSGSYLDEVLTKAIQLEYLTKDELLFLYQNAPLGELMTAATLIRNKFADPNTVTWMIDRNINITNICVCGCNFCNFYTKANSPLACTTTKDEYRLKINELFKKGGNQILLQGGLNPKLKLNFYTKLFEWLKHEFPTLKIHALGPPEINFISKLEKISIPETLTHLINAGLDSLPGAGAEILSDRVRKIISPNKCSASDWLEVMRQAHKINLLTSATMVFGHVETIEERIEHLLLLRKLQNEKPAHAHGFKAFIAWTLQKANTMLMLKNPEIETVTASEYIRMIALSRLALVNIQNIQASWLTVGKDVAQICLHAGANDLGSIMIEENVVASTGTHFSMNAKQMQQTIIEAGYVPLKRNQDYGNFRKSPYTK